MTPMGRPRKETADPALVKKVKAALLRGDTAQRIRDALGCGSSLITRISREIKDEAREQVIAKLVKRGMSRASAVNIFNEMKGVGQ
jgi:Trp operon repressor